MTNVDKTHYVYKITNLNPIDEQQFYIGLHSDDNPDSLNDGYMGSSKYLDKAMKEQGKENFKKEILSTWDTRLEAALEEIMLLKDNKHLFTTTFYNRAIPCKEHAFIVAEGLFDGKFTVIDTRTNKNVFITIAELNKYDYYQMINKGKVTVLDLRDGITKNVTTEDYTKHSFYKSINYGTVPVKDIRDNSTKRVSKEDFKKFDHYVSVNAKTINIFDNNNILQYTSYGQFPTFCEEHNLPCQKLKKSYQQDGKPLYENINNSTVSMLTRTGNIKYKGWYAVKG